MVLQAIEKVGEAVKSLFDYTKEIKTKQSETQLINDKKRLKKATNVAEKIFQITDQYTLKFSQEHKKEYEKLRREFDKKD